jgi:glycosyltransferase involved in cell wall biosynthesis
MSDKLSIIIPAYNEGKHIYVNITRCMETFSSQELDYELILVDDGSTDNTRAEAKKIISPRLKVVGYSTNKGKGHAILYGLKYADGELVTFLDADLDLDPRQIDVFMDHMKRYNADVVIGSKRHPLTKIEFYPQSRRFFSAGYNILLKAIFGLSMSDTQAGFKLFKKEVLEVVAPKLLVKRFAFDVEILAYAHSSGYKIVEAPLVMNFHRGSWGRLKIEDIVRIGIDTMAIACRFHIPQSCGKILRDSGMMLIIFLLLMAFYNLNLTVNSI